MTKTDKMTLSQELSWRGFIQDTTLTDIKELDSKQWVFYIGFDASAPSQTVGNLAAMMAVRTFLRHGHRAVILAGGATSLIGDPGGKNQERELQSQQVIAANILNAQEQFKTIFKDYDQQVSYVNNLDWFKDFKLIDFLRDVGKNFSMTPLIQRDYIASRLGEGGTGISYAEFSYTLLQGYDYLKLYEDYNCTLQLGGSDQWGNCLSGVDLIRRKHQTSCHVITLPLVINKATGKKFGKSEEQTIWLDKNLTHPSDFYQFWFNTSDQDVMDYLRIFTDLSPVDYNQIKQEQVSQPAARPAQRILADKMTEMVCGKDYLQLAQLFSRLAFAKKQTVINQQDHQLITNNWSAVNCNPDLDAEIVLQTDTNGQYSSANILGELEHKIPILHSQTQIKQLLREQAIKLVIYNLEKRTITTEPLNNYLDKNHSKWSSKIQQALLVIVGKNTIRVIRYQ